MKRKAVRLENWSVIFRGTDYSSPEQQELCFQGDAYGHPEFDDGVFLHTTGICGYKQGIFLTRSGRKYALGEVDPNYEAQFPDALNRVIKSAQEKK